jgi:dipeptidyl aminopeptidase/acylaminoacyl peptidase
VPPGLEAPAPLLVALHTWSGNYRQGSGRKYLEQAVARKWVLIHPDFRGPNRRPEACASDLAVQDVLDAVAYAREHATVDPRRVYLVGASGGGHMALMMAARAPGLWAGVSAWVPISDLAAWHAETKRAGRKYWRDCEAACGGPPGPDTAGEYRRRSPLFHLTAAKGVPVDINAGIHDGHNGSVPVSHSLRAFNVLAEANGQPQKELAVGEIEQIVAKRRIPDHLSAASESLAGRRARAVLFHRTAGPARVTLFDGGHEGDVPAALDWLAAQEKGDSE